MGVRRVVTCDKCGKEFDERGGSDQPVNIDVTVTFGSTRSGQIGGVKKSSIWCRSCIMGSGVVPPKNKKDKELAPVELTTEQKLIILFEELGFIRE